MAGAEDDIEKLLREVDGALGGKGSAAPARKESAEKPAGRLKAGVPKATALGAAWGVGVGGLFGVLPLLDAISGGIAAFAAAFSVSLVGSWRRRR